MAFIPPKTFAVGEVLSAIDMNTFVRDNTNDLDGRINALSGPLSFIYVGRRIVTETTTLVFDDLFGDGRDTSFVRAVYFRGVGGGGGGGGGGTTSRVGGGGGSGAYTEVFTTAVNFLKPDFLVTIGAGGAGGSAGSSGSAGTETQMPAGFATLGGGLGGSISVISQAGDMRSALGGPGGITASPQVTNIETLARLRFAGNRGGHGISVITSSDASGLKLGGTGADSPFGSGGGPGQNKTTGVSGFSGTGFGSGGGGAADDAATGGNGAPGVMIFDFYR